jgi:predicted DsbA family dithiol-disulfide isomerase
MLVEIWSDIVCPFCYIGKRSFEVACQQFAGAGQLKVQWKSFQLDPDARPTPGISPVEYLAERKGQSVEWAHKAHDHVTAMAAGVGLTYNLHKAIVANTFSAHRLLQAARLSGHDDALEEELFAAYFTHGKDVASFDVLTACAVAAGMDVDAAASVLQSDAHADDVQADIDQASVLGIRGVPCFVIDRRYAISGAQPPDVIRQVLEKAAAARS